MKRVNLLSTDQPSSGSKMATTGLSTPSGSTRTKATKGLFSHFMFLASLLLIALLTSGKVLAQDETYTVTMATDEETCHIKAPAEAIAIATHEFTLVASDGYKLPATLTSVVYDATTANTTLELNADLSSQNQYSYDQETGVITISNATNIANGKVITITATAEKKSNDATLSTLTYSNTNISTGTAQNVSDFSAATIPDITLEYNKSLESSAITMAGTLTDANAKITANNGATITDGMATATVTVTAEDGVTTKDYVVNFKVANDKLSSITVPTVTLTKKVSSADDVLTVLNADPYNSFAVVTAGEQENVSLPVTWTFTGEKFTATAEATNDFTWTIAAEALTAKKLDQNKVVLTGTATITNPAASTDATLATLTYTVNGGDPVNVTGFTTSDNTTPQTYTVTLPATTPKDAEITVAATANDEAAEIASEAGLTATLDANKATITFTVTPESGAEAKRTITINFTREKSTVVTLSELNYQIADGTPIAVEGFKADDTDGETYAVTLPFGTPATATITILPVATDANAVITPADKTVTLSAGAGTITLTVTAEDETTNQEIVINFTTAPEQVTEVIVPEKFTLVEEGGGNTSAKAIAQLEKMEGVTIKTNGSTEMKLAWEYKDTDNGNQAYATTHGQKNNFRWTVKTAADGDLTAVEGVDLSGLVKVTNYIAAVTEDKESITVNADDPYTQIGSSEEESITVGSVTVSTTVDKLAFDNVTVSGAVTINSEVPTITLNNTEVGGKIDLQASVPSIVLSNASVDEIALASSQTTELTVQPDSRIAKITNAGTLTLTDEASVAALSMALETKAAALENEGAVKAVENNGVFTDNTASIVAVTGAANVAISSQPKDRSTTETSVKLSVEASASDDAVLTYQWEKKISGTWTDAKGTGNKTATLTVGKTDDGAGSFRCKVVSTKNSATTTLYTPAVAVTFRTESGPSEPSTPSTPTYTVSLDKVTGATFSKGETTTVDEGDNFSFKITLDKDYDQSKPVVTVDGTAITADADGNYTIKNIRKDIKIVVSGIVKNTATGIEENVADAARAWSVGSTLYIHVPEAADVYVVNGTGALQQQLRGVSGDYNMQLRAGFYIVRIGNVSQKVIIR